MEATKPCVRCGRIPADGWYSKSGYCGECAEIILDERKAQMPTKKRPFPLVLIILLSFVVVGVLVGVLVAGNGGNKNESHNALRVPPTHSDYATFDQRMAAVAATVKTEISDELNGLSLESEYSKDDNAIRVVMKVAGITEGEVKDGVGSASFMKSWSDFRGYVCEIGNSILGGIDAAKGEGIDSIVMLVDESDSSVILIESKNAEIEFDILDGYEPVDVLDGDIEAVSGDGSGDKVITTKPASDSRICKINFTHNGKHNFIVKDVGLDDLLVNEIGSWSGTYLFTPGSHSYEITADGDWEYSVSAIDKGSRSGASGNGDDVSGWFNSVEPSRTSFSHSGDSNFIVMLFCPDTGDYDYVVNEIGEYNGEQYMEFDPSKRYIWIVTANGGWSISVG